MPSSLAALAAFREFLENILHKHFRRNQQALAEAVGIDVRSLRRTLKPDEGKHTFSLEHCLQLAHAIRENASYVLVKADKAEQAQLIESLYGRARLSPTEDALLAAWHQLDRPEQEKLLNALQNWVAITVRQDARNAKETVSDDATRLLPKPTKKSRPRRRKR